MSCSQCLITQARKLRAQAQEAQAEASILCAEAKLLQESVADQRLRVAKGLAQATKEHPSR